MPTLNRNSLKNWLFAGALCLAGGWPTAFAQTSPASATATTNGDSAVVVEVISSVPTVPEALVRERLASLQKTIPLPYHKTIHGFIDYFTFRKASYIKTQLERQPIYFTLYERMLAKYGLPDELKYLSMVESALNPRAVSRSGAGGLWQFMPGTGRELRLYQDEYVDERMEPVKSTEAACQYLRDLYNTFGDWELAMAAYNCGPGAVKRAMRRSGGDTFWTIYDALPKETRSYVPLFVAHVYMLNYANDHGIVAEELEYPIPFDTIQVNGYLNVPTLARLSGMSVVDLQKLNPHLTTGILPDYTHNFMLRLPSEQFDHFAAHRRAILDSATKLPGRLDHVLLADGETVRYNTEKHDRLPAPADESAPAPEAVLKAADKAAAVAAVNQPDNDDDIETVVKRKPSKLVYVVRRKDNLADIADRFNVEVYDLKRWNHLRSTRLHTGQKMVMYREAAETRVERLAQQGTPKAIRKTELAVRAKTYKPRYHFVQDGDTLWNIAQRYGGIPIDRLKKLNKIHGNSLRPGQKLIVG